MYRLRFLRYFSKKKIVAACLTLLVYFVFRQTVNNVILPTDSNIVINLVASRNNTLPSFIAEKNYDLNNRIRNVIKNEDPEVSSKIIHIEEEEVKEPARQTEAKLEDIKELEEPELNLNSHYEEMIRLEEEAVVKGLGEYGKPVEVIPGVTQSEVDRIFKQAAFNKILSDKVSLTRRIPDARNLRCARVTYDEELPSASVIVAFINEAWSTLLRTVHSVLLRTPEQYLKEIILVDDSSTNDELKGKLDYYIKTRLPDKVKIIRLKTRHGLIKAKIVGAEAAIGEVLVYLDAHCECVIDWLQPMLQRIKEERTAVVTPIIDVIDDRTLGYLYSTDNSFQIGGFTWSGHFTWIPIPDFELRRRESDIAPTRSPTMAGGLFAIDKRFFFEIGGYDDRMEVWGGENLEMSFRIWQCGGSLEIIPCSRVGHIFRSFHPYSFPENKDTHGINTARMVEVWMDDYKRLFYYYRPDLKRKIIGSIADRKKLREDLKCADFRWYLKNVIPQKFILDEDVKHYGRLRTKVRLLCLDNLNQPDDKPHDLGVYECHNKLSAQQFFSLSLKDELRREELCAEVFLKNIRIPGLKSGVAKGNLTLAKCDGSRKQKWLHEGELLQHLTTGYCIHWLGAVSGSLITVADCDPSVIFFKWTWEFQVMPDNKVVRRF